MALKNVSRENCRDAAVVIVNPKQIPVSGLKGHGHTEVADILLHKRPGPAVGLQIPPLVIDFIPFILFLQDLYSF